MSNNSKIQWSTKRRAIQRCEYVIGWGIIVGPSAGIVKELVSFGKRGWLDGWPAGRPTDRPTTGIVL